MIPKNGYLKTTVDVRDAMRRLSSHIKEVPRRYKKLSVEELTHRREPGKWSRQEVLGHLIDSAINNIKRFTEIQFSPQPYVIIPYQQDDLVAKNNYQNLPLPHLLKLWQLLNRQVLYVVKNTSDESLAILVNPQYESNEMKTLAWVICDYVAHLEHHLKDPLSP